jgi:membrane associated rhomboid family serine protease
VPQQLQEFYIRRYIAAGYMMLVSFIIPMPAYLWNLYLLYSIYGMRAKNDNIGHTAHFGGAIGGYVITLISIRI